MKSRFTNIVCLIACFLCYVNAEVFPSPIEEENDTDYWYKLGRDEIQDAIQRPKLTNVAKNVILFLGDGMGITVSTAGRIYKGQKENGVAGEEGYLVWERFPNMGLMKTYNLDRQVADSAGTATAYLGGVKANYQTIGVNGKVKVRDCEGSLKEENRVHSVLKWAMEAGKGTGFVTTTRVTHATPAGLYAKTAHRDWEADTNMIEDGLDVLESCKDIARQLIEDEPGKNIQVIMGGGRKYFGVAEDNKKEADTNVEEDDDSEEDENEVEENSFRLDKKNLVHCWKEDKEKRGKSHSYVSSASQLKSVDAENTDYIMGLFGDSHMEYEVDKDPKETEVPRMKEMVEVALKRLRRNENGFFLMVEGGKIDKGLHNGQPKKCLEELVAFEEAVELALKMVNLEETLIVVTADHSHTMTMNGYPTRGNNILGTTVNHKDITDGLPYTTLMFTNGPGFYYSYNGNEVVRRNLTGVDTTDKDFISQAAIPSYADSETHGGEDVAAYALGPMGHLFHRLHEQSYVAHVMGYAACIGPYKDCDRPPKVPINEYRPIRNQVREPLRGDSARAASSCFGILLLITLHVLRFFNYNEHLY